LVEIKNWKLLISKERKDFHGWKTTIVALMKPLIITGFCTRDPLLNDETINALSARQNLIQRFRKGQR